MYNKQKYNEKYNMKNQTTQTLNFMCYHKKQ